MKIKTNSVLVFLLVVQLVLIVVSWRSSDPFHIDEAKAFFSIDNQAVESIEITTSDGESESALRFEKRGDNWVYASAEDYPAKGEAINELLSSLDKVTVRDPIASSAASHASLGVGEQNYQRRFTFSTPEKEEQYFVGRGRGNSVHLRRQGEDEVYRGRGAAFGDFSASIENYLDTKVVDLPENGLTRVEIDNPLGAFELTKVGGDWRLSGAPDLALDAESLSTFLNDISNLFMVRPVGKKMTLEQGLGHGTRVKLSYEQDGTQKTLDFTIGKATPAADGYFAKVDGNDYVLVIKPYKGEKLTTFSVDKLLPQPETTPSSPAFNSPNSEALPTLMGP